MRSTIFNLLYHSILTLSLIVCLPVLLVNGDKLATRIISFLAKIIIWLFSTIMKVDIEIRGEKYIPEEGPALLAAKHHSEFDPIFMLSLLDDVAVLTLKLQMPFANWYLSHIGMIMIERVKNKTGKTVKEVEDALLENKIVLIYPEGRLTEVGENTKFKIGIWHFYDQLKMPVTPVATNIGLRWAKYWHKNSGPAIVEFLPEIKLGLSKEKFFEKLEKAIQEKSDELIEEQK